MLEETGADSHFGAFRFAFDEEIAHTSVFEVEATGKLKGSWEGEPKWASVPELTNNIFSNHVPVLAFFQKYSVLAVGEASTITRTDRYACRPNCTSINCFPAKPAIWLVRGGTDEDRFASAPRGSQW